VTHLISVIVHRLNGPIRGRPILSISVDDDDRASDVLPTGTKCTPNRPLEARSSEADAAELSAEIQRAQMFDGTQAQLCSTLPGIEVRCLNSASPSRTASNLPVSAALPVDRGHKATARFLEAGKSSREMCLSFR